MVIRHITIRGARHDRALTQAQVAEKLGISLPTYGEMERNPGRITWDEASRLAEIFGRSVEEFAFHTPEDDE